MSYREYYPQQEEEDPYERGFAHKLYEDYDREPYLQDTMEEPTEPEEQYSYRPKKKKRRPFRTLFMLILILLLSVGAVLLTLHFLAEMPMAEEEGRIDGACTILLAGTDESGDRTDTIMLLHINREEKEINLLSIPRDTRVNSSYWPQKINSAYGMNGCGEEGMEALMDYVSQCVGFRPDGYLLLELDVFIELVDLFGGVKFEVPMNMDYEDSSQDLYIHLQEGMQTLDGEEAMGLVRYRYGYADADIGRVSVQRDFLMAAVDQWAKPRNVVKLPRAMDLLKENSVSDLSGRNMLWFAESLLLCGTENMYTTTVPYYISGDYVIIDDDETYLDCINDYFNPYEAEISWDDLNVAH
ncbi:MAG: LCP family protein [Oscillospiraceae bacterium]|nr:LCP family protein [Oscillospiraceae bacterium]